MRFIRLKQSFPFCLSFSHFDLEFVRTWASKVVSIFPIKKNKMVSICKASEYPDPAPRKATSYFPHFVSSRIKSREISRFWLLVGLKTDADKLFFDISVKVLPKPTAANLFSLIAPRANHQFIDLSRAIQKTLRTSPEGRADPKERRMRAVASEFYFIVY